LSQEDKDMAEVSKQAKLLINTSFQALGRINFEDKDTFFCNCLVTVVFAGFYLEASLDYLIQEIGKQAEFKEFLEGKRYPGMQDKLAWFYYHYVVKSEEVDEAMLYKKDKDDKQVSGKLEEEFKGFSKIRDFRNDISHGGNVYKAIERINEFKTREDIVQLRTQAKQITDKLIDIANKAEHTNIEKKITFYDVVGPNTRSESSS
jgi:hypothetical protein